MISLTVPFSSISGSNIGELFELLFGLSKIFLGLWDPFSKLSRSIFDNFRSRDISESSSGGVSLLITLRYLSMIVFCCCAEVTSVSAVMISDFINSNLEVLASITYLKQGTNLQLLINVLTFNINKARTA